MAAVTSDAASRRQFVAMVFCRLQNKGISKAFHWMNGNNFSIGEGGGGGQGRAGGGSGRKGCSTNSSPLFAKQTQCK